MKKETGNKMAGIFSNDESAKTISKLENSQGKLHTAQYDWDVGSLSWVRETQPAGGGGG